MVTPEIHKYTIIPQAKKGTRTQIRKWIIFQPWIAPTFPQVAKELCDNIVRPNDDEIKVAPGVFALTCLSMKKSGARIWIERHMNGILDCLALNVWLKRNMTTCQGYGILLVWSYHPFCSVKGNPPRGRWVLGHNMFGLCARIRYPHTLDMM